MATRATQNKIYVFCASRQTAETARAGRRGARRGSAAAGVLGMGTMGAGIAQALLSAGIRRGLRPECTSALMAGVERIRASLDRRVGQGKLAAAKAEAAMARLTPTTDPASLGVRAIGDRGRVRGRGGEARGDRPIGSNLPGRNDHRHQHLDDQPGRIGRGDAASGRG